MDVNDTIEICISEIDGLPICFQIDNILRFGNADPLHAQERTLNVADYLGRTRAKPQRSAFLGGPTGEVQLLLGAHIAVRILPLTCLHRLPYMVIEHGDRLGIIGSLNTETGLGYLLNTNTLIARMTSG